MSSFYEMQMLNLPSKYRISKNAQRILKFHEDFKTGKIDEAELGRLIRLSPGNRAAATQTMVKLARMMQTSPEESKYCLAIIESCGEIVSIADKPPSTAGFPSFMKLPAEIRTRIYDFYLHAGQVGNVVIPYPKKGNCFCAGFEEPTRYWSAHKRNISLALTSKQLSEEVLTSFYNRIVVHFPCACEMGWHLKKNSSLKKLISKIQFHWCGPQADIGIARLRKCSLDSLTVTISKVTLKHLNSREQELQLYFCSTRGRKNGQPGLPEALGFDELTSLRGIKSIDVQRERKNRAEELGLEEKANLLRWLEAKVVRPADDD